jgi:hypothetical protein
LKGFIVKLRHVIRTHRPLKGLVAFVRAAAAMQSQHACSASLQQPIAMGYCLDRNEGPLSPGEGSA